MDSKLTTLIGIALWAMVPGFIARNKGRNFWKYYFLSFLISPLITTIITICQKKLTVVVDNQNNIVPSEIKTLSDNQNIKFCHKCGYELKNKSMYCSRCGAKIGE